MSIAVKRLLSDISNLHKNPLHDNGIYYQHDETNIYTGYAMIVGPKNTPYFGGFYFFTFTFTNEYPFVPPKVEFTTSNGKTRFNPNLYVDGKVCLSILNTWQGEKWSACQTIRSVLLVLCSLLNEQPLLNEPGFDGIEFNCKPYNKIIEYMNIDYTICEQLRFYSNTRFYTIMTELFLQNYDELIEFVRSKNKERCVISTVYSMTVHINYNELEAKLGQIRDLVNAN
jgi:ubiquitin-protein ligase